MASFRRYARIGFLIPLALLAVLPSSASAAGFFGPILPQSGSCHCGNLPMDWGCVLQVLQNLIQFAVSFGVILVVIWIAYAGFSLMVSGGSAEARSQGKTRIVNALVGLVVLLAAWLVVDFVMKVLYNENAAFDGGYFGPWNSILADTGGNYCIQPHEPVAITSGSILSNIVGVSPGTTSGAGYGATPGGSLCTANSSCTPQSLQGLGVSSSQAQALSCIAQTESGGNPYAINTQSKACGLFQITNQTSKSNWQNPANHQSPCNVSTPCTNAQCNEQTAVIMFKKSGYTPWTCPGCNNKAAGCVAKFDP